MHMLVRPRLALRAALFATALFAVGLLAASSAGAATISWSVPLTGQDVINSGLPADASATGHADITGDDSNNRMCGTFTWSGVNSPVGFGHIHEGEAGQPENPAVTINFFGPPTNLNGFPSGVSGCTTVPNALIDDMNRYGALFNVVIHTVQYPGGALRGQLGCGTLLFNWQCGGF
jgi:hypothetical protein